MGSRWQPPVPMGPPPAPPSSTLASFGRSAPKGIIGSTPIVSKETGTSKHPTVPPPPRFDPPSLPDLPTPIFLAKAAEQAEEDMRSGRIRKRSQLSDITERTEDYQGIGGIDNNPDPNNNYGSIEKGEDVVSIASDSHLDNDSVISNSDDEELVLTESRLQTPEPTGEEKNEEDFSKPLPDEVKDLDVSEEKGVQLPALDHVTNLDVREYSVVRKTNRTIPLVLKAKPKYIESEMSTIYVEALPIIPADVPIQSRNDVRKESNAEICTTDSDCIDNDGNDYADIDIDAIKNDFVNTNNLNSTGDLGSSELVPLVREEELSVDTLLEMFERELKELKREVDISSRPLPPLPPNCMENGVIIIGPDPPPRSESICCTKCFGKRNGINCRRATDCVCLLGSEMIVIDYPETQNHPNRSMPQLRSVRTGQSSMESPPPPVPPRPPRNAPPRPPRGLTRYGIEDVSKRPPRNAPPRPPRGLKRHYPVDYPVDVPSTSYPNNTTQVFVNGAGDDDTLVRVKHRREKSGSQGSLGPTTNTLRRNRVRSTASSVSTAEGDETSSGMADGGDSEEEDDESCPSHEGYLELKDCVRECLEKEPCERNAEDVAILLDFMQHMAAFATLPESIKRQLCLKMVFAVVNDAGTIVMQNNERIDAWAVIVNGCVEVVTPNGDRIEYKLGDSFGADPVNNVQYHVGDMRTLVDDCEFVLVEHKDFCSIMSTIGEHIECGRDDITGEVISETERRTVGSQVGLVLIKGKPEKLLMHVVEERDGQVDPTYVDDFLLTYRVFIHDPVFIFEKLMHWFAEPQYRDRVARIVLLWVNNHYNDFESNEEMMKLLERFEQALERDQMHSQQSLLNIACSVKAKPRNIVYTRADKDDNLHFTVMGGKEINCAVFVSDVQVESLAEKAGLKRGDEIIEVNGQSMKYVTLSRAIDLLKGSTTLKILLKSNILGFKEMLQHPEKDGFSKTKNRQLHGVLSQPRGSVPNVIPQVINGNGKNKMQGNRGMMEKLFNIIKHPKDGDTELSTTSISDLRQSRSNPDIINTISQYYGPIRSDSPEHVLKIYRSDQTFKYLSVFRETTAQNVVQLALQEFNMTAEGSLEWSLCEVSVTDNHTNKVIKQKRLPPQMENLAERISLNSRYYLKNINRSEPLVPDDLAPEILKEAEANLLSLNAQIVAAQLTLQDFAIFASIEPTEYIDCLFKLTSRQGWPRLEEFERVFNKEMWWVASEVCCEKNVYRRAKLIKKFIKVARHCRDLYNFNSMFAIVMGLAKPSVCRLHNSWEKVGSKHVRFFEEVQTLIDPSRNMSRYRQHLATVSEHPPVVPIFPVIKKDLTFLHEGNPTYSDKLVNFEKLRMIAREVKRVTRLSSLPYEIGSMAERSGSGISDALLYMNDFDNGTGTVATMRKSSKAVQPRKKVYEQALMVRKVKTYLENVKVVESEMQLDSLSLECEPASNTAKNQRTRAPSPTPSSLSSLSNGSDPKLSTGSKFGIDSPQAVQKMLALVQNSKVKGISPVPSPAPSTRSSNSRQFSGQKSTAPPSLRGSRSSVPSIRRVPSGRENPVDLSRESSSVTNFYGSSRPRSESVLAPLFNLSLFTGLAAPTHSSSGPPSPSPSSSNFKIHDRMHITMRLSAVRMACRIGRVNPSNTALLVCDIQDKFSKQIQFFPEIVVTSKRLIDAARILGMKTVATEQYPKGLGHLVPELGIEPNGDIPVFDKSKFSMCIEPVLPHLKDTKNVILCGIEAHVCVLQTTLDLLERGFEVHVVADAVSSRTQENRKFAFKQLERAGAVLTTSECVILGLVGGADHPKFKEVQKLIMQSAPDTGLCKL